MSELWRILGRMWAFMFRRPLDADLDAELAAHLEMAIEDNMARGLPPAEARRLALVKIGGVEQARYLHREARGFMDIDILSQDLRFTFRTLWRDPSFTAVAILILALAIGANIAVFSVVNTLLLRPLPFPSAQQLVWIAPPPTKCGLSCATYSTDAYDQFRTMSSSYQDVTGYFAFSSADNLSLNLGGAPIPATSIDVIQNFFKVLGVQAQIGRTFTPEDARNGAAPVVILTNAWWKRQFNGDPNIVGKAFDMNGQQTTVIGVLPASFDFGAVFAPGTKVDALTPLNLYGPPRDWGNIITFIGRMRPGVSLGQARDEAARIAPHMCWNNKHPETCGDYKGAVVPVPLKDYISGKLRRSLIVLWAAVGAILLIACVNLSNLLLARASARSKEFAMRGALGASRARIVRQLLTESLVLAGFGAVFGLMLAWTLVSWFAHQGAIALPLLSTLHIDSAALGWTVLIAIFAAVVFGLVPGLRVSSGNLQESLKDAGPGASASRKHELVRSILVVCEVALACMLLVGAGLLLRSFMRVLDVDLGFEPDRAAAIMVDYQGNPADGNGSTPTSQNAITNRRAVFQQQVLSRIESLPGVEAAGFTDYLPLGQNRAWGTPLPKGAKRPDHLDTGPLVYVISPGYMHAMGTRVRGRDFTWSDGPTGQQVVMINESYARFLNSFGMWSDGNAIGKPLANGGGSDLIVVGVVSDVHEESVDGDAGWQIYYPNTQAGPNGLELVVRSSIAPSNLATSVLSTLREINPKQPMAEFKPIRLLVNHAVSGRQFFMLLVVSFATLGLLLAALGIYGVISYSVTRQTQEIGIRMALGASAGIVQRQILAGTLRLTIIGVVLGAAASILGSRLMASLLFATSPWDAVTYVSMATALLAIAAISGYIPAFRASRINPIVALRAN
ncbi:ABC transporter permease [Telmatobacter sp. DSM 110680]|uniref:ABC transporter permease n=1 Tax=Telmatobacter sp. DSM 110680 TaxID=3036704 RepID=A0AAU7DL38_9BACT